MLPTGDASPIPPYATGTPDVEATAGDEHGLLSQKRFPLAPLGWPEGLERSGGEEWMGLAPQREERLGQD